MRAGLSLDDGDAIAQIAALPVRFKATAFSDQR
jgi:hypothetical protein